MKLARIQAKTRQVPSNAIDFNSLLWSVIPETQSPILRRADRLRPCLNSKKRCDKKSEKYRKRSEKHLSMLVFNAK